MKHTEGFSNILETPMEDAMWTSTLELDPAHVIPTKILGSFWRGAYFSSFAPLQVQNLPRQPLPASNWVRVRNAMAGVCGSDLHLIFVDGDFSIAPAALPSHNRIYPGHEVVGEVIEVGENVQTLRVGDRVVLQHGPNCLTAGIQPPCRSCSSGNYALCESGVLPGPQPIGGGWSEEMLLHEQQLFRISPNISDSQAVLLEPSAVAVHAALRWLPQPGDRVLIIGAGTIGQLVLQVIRALAPDAEVNVLARHAFQIERAASLGARIIYPQDSYEGVQIATGAQLYRGMFGNKMLLGGYDVIYDTIGSSSTTHDALRWARAGSAVVMVGLSLHRMHIDLTPIWYQEVNLIGTLAHGIENWPIGTAEKKTTFEITAELIESGLLHPDKLITHTFLLSQYRAALTTARDKARHRVMKVVFDFSKQPPSVVPNVRAAARQRRFDTLSPPDPSWSQESVSQGVGEDITTGATTKQAPYDVAGQYGSLPGFHQGLEELGIAPRQDDDDTSKVASVPPSQPIPNTPLIHTDEANVEAPLNADEANIEPPFIASTTMDSGSDYTWTQFMTPQDSSEGSVEFPPAAPSGTISSNVETPFPTPSNSGESDDDPKTVIVSPAKRPRSRRGPVSNQAALTGENKQSIPAVPLNSPQQEEALQETEQEPGVTTDPPDTLVE